MKTRCENHSKPRAECPACVTAIGYAQASGILNKLDGLLGTPVVDFFSALSAVWTAIKGREGIEAGPDFWLKVQAAEEAQDAINGAEPAPAAPDPAQGAKIMAELQAEVASWGDQTFGDTQTIAAMLKHMAEEVGELGTAIAFEGPVATQMEAADVAILLFGVAHREGFDLGKAIEAKMAVNRLRRWKKPDQDGVIKHEKDSK